jgi:large subunit ribosomal protein L3
MNGILGKKIGMTQVFTESGERLAVTVLEAGPCHIVQQKTEENEGYSSFQVGFEEKKQSRTSKPLEGHFKKANITPKKTLVEFAAENPDEWEVGQSYDVSIFEGVENVVVSGTSKGRGFSGTIKRYGFAKGPRTHGSHNVRAPGSLGACSYPGRVFPGKKMPGQYGNKRVSVKNLSVVKIDKERNLLFIKGAVPGPKNGLIEIRKG